MKFIDCSATIGYGAVNHVVVNHEGFTLIEKVAAVKDSNEMLEYMDYCGIERALVTHQTMMDVTPEYGNARLIEQTQNSRNRLMPVWNILPPMTDETFLPEYFFPEMRKHNVLALCASPQSNRYFLNSITMGELLIEIERRKIPLFLSPVHGYEHIYALLSEYTSMRVIVKNYGPWSPDRYWFPLLRTYKHIYFETGDYQTDGGIERIVNKFGSERLLFGTDFPTNNMGGSIGVLIAANITQNDKEKISHENIERLLSEVVL